MNEFEKWLKNELEIIEEHYTEYVGDKDVHFLTMCIMKGDDEETVNTGGDLYISANNRYWAEDKDTPVNINSFAD